MFFNRRWSFMLSICLCMPLHITTISLFILLSFYLSISHYVLQQKMVFHAFYMSLYASAHNSIISINFPLILSFYLTTWTSTQHGLSRALYVSVYASEYYSLSLFSYPHVAVFSRSNLKPPSFLSHCVCFLCCSFSVPCIFMCTYPPKEVQHTKDRRQSRSQPFGTRPFGNWNISPKTKLDPLS